ncbi:MAG: protein-L-isoaspartate(D-aspartate) O-methyltransferase [Bacteroidetes bacterium]|nr:protein-L-isoaspartate(D-aspartate) O-methyltransferase [Bacteroidota bacterium]
MHRPNTDTFRHQGLRKKLVKQLEAKGISDPLVLGALERVPRHFFLDVGFEEIAYEDRAFPIEADQTISHPYTVAFQTQLLEVKKWARVLEVGTGSAYQAAVLAEMGARVFTVERQRTLYDQVRTFQWLSKKYPMIEFFYGDGYAGQPTYAPFDRILVTAGAPHIPEKLIAQLKVGGILVVPVGEGDAQRMYRVLRVSETETKEEIFGEFQFVPMLKGKT